MSTAKTWLPCCGALAAFRPIKRSTSRGHLCAGLAAAHTKGVLHRDLKPANIMLDGRGQVVITDFGLAGVADNLRGAEIRSGTPAYMAPEQLAGKEVTMRSDIYALGLVLYEVFTGKRAVAESPALARSRGDHTPSRPSSVVKDLDPIVEKVILRCLEEEPSARPPTALAVAAALSGGDPLAAALAAGETPSRNWSPRPEKKPACVHEWPWLAWPACCLVWRWLLLSPFTTARWKKWD
jgi:serine/threonine protein kinase